MHFWRLKKSGLACPAGAETLRDEPVSGIFPGGKSVISCVISVVRFHLADVSAATFVELICVYVYDVVNMIILRFVVQLSGKVP